MTVKRLHPPKHLQPETRAWWASVARDYALEQHHFRLLTLAAESWDRCEQARAVLDRDGMTVLDDRKNLRLHPLVAVEKDSRIAFARLVRELDLDAGSPASNRVGPPSLRSNSGGR